jgi:iron complex transport system substrate-binding protein
MRHRLSFATRFTKITFLLASLLSAGVFPALPAGQPGDAAGLSPRRLISLGPTITEKLYLLGVQDRLVGVTTYCERPPEALAKEKIGNVTQVNIEKIVELKPDLVFATSLTERKAIESLKRLGIGVIVFNEPRSYAETNRQFLELGRIVGRERKAEEIVRVEDRRVDAIKQRIKGLSRPKVFVQLGAKPLFAATKDSFVNDFIEFAGGTNIAREAKSGFYSREEVLRQDPDIIIIVGMDAAAGNEKKEWQKFHSLRAVKNDKIFIMDPYRVCSPTPRTFVDALEEMVKALHPGA